MIEKICEVNFCTGCGACSQVCPQSAIAMKENDEGFLYPQINVNLCSNCALCVETCPVNKDKSGTELKHNAYACFTRDENIRKASSSGGIFTELAIKIISEKGVVFGAGFDENFAVRHSSAENAEELDNLRRSKYVQSDTASTFREAKELLKTGRRVLYCGTPCQIAGLKAFLGREYENLLTCDLACHGVPSPKIWRMFLDFLGKKHNSRIKAVSFRDKSTGWRNSSMKVDFENGSLYKDRVKKETFFIGFGKSIFNRLSCYNCKFRIDNTKADITLADFWGIDRQNDADFSDDKGVSLAITHTPAGEKAMEAIGGSICIKKRELEEAVKYNPRLVSSVAEPAGRKSFFDDLRAGYDFDRLRRKYMDNFSLRYKLKTLAKKLLGRA